MGWWSIILVVVGSVMWEPIAATKGLSPPPKAEAVDSSRKGRTSCREEAPHLPDRNYNDRYSHQSDLPPIGRTSEEHCIKWCGGGRLSPGRGRLSAGEDSWLPTDVINDDFVVRVVPEAGEAAEAEDSRSEYKDAMEVPATGCRGGSVSHRQLVRSIILVIVSSVM